MQRTNQLRHRMTALHTYICLSASWFVLKVADGISIGGNISPRNTSRSYYSPEVVQFDFRLDLSVNATDFLEPSNRYDTSTVSVPLAKNTTETPIQMPKNEVPGEVYNLQLDFLLPESLVVEQTETDVNVSDILNWTLMWNNPEGYFEEDRNTKEHSLYEEFATPSMVTLKILSLNCTSNVSITGSLRAQVSNSATQGKGFSVDMHTAVQHNEMSSNVTCNFKSTLLYTTPPITNISLSQSEIPIGHRAMLEITSHLNKGKISPIYVTNIPFDKEPQLTVTNMQIANMGDDVTTTSTQGNKDFRSSESWTRDDLGRWKGHGLYEVKTDAGDALNRTMTFQTEVRMEDLESTTNDTVTWLGTGIHYGGDILWVGQVPVRSVVQWPRRPELKVGLRFTGTQYSYTYSHNLRYEVSVSHTENSTAYAHDVTIKFYLMPLLQHVSTRWTSNVKSYTKNVQGNILTLVINRVLFSDNAKIQFDIRHPLKEYAELDYYVNVAEMQYWFIDDNVTQVYESDMTYARNVINAEWPKDPDPICHCIPGNISSGICPCCAEGLVACGLDAPGVCVPRGLEVLCRTAHTEHWKTTKFIDGETHYVCNYAKGWKFDSLYSCFVQRKAKAAWEGASPQLGTIQGQHTGNGYIYGTGNNGMACVMSRDGYTWFSLDCSYYERAKTSQQWKAASKISVTKDKPLYSRDIGAFSLPSKDPGCIKQEVGVPQSSCEGLNMWTVLGDVTVANSAAQDGATSCVVNPAGGNFSQSISLGNQHDQSLVKVRMEAYSKCGGWPCTATDYSIFIKSFDKVTYFNFNKHTTGWQRGQVEMAISNITQEVHMGAIFNSGISNAYFDSFKVTIFSELDPFVCLMIL